MITNPPVNGEWAFDDRIRVERAGGLRLTALYLLIVTERPKRRHAAALQRAPPPKRRLLKINTFTGRDVACVPVVFDESHVRDEVCLFDEFGEGAAAGEDELGGGLSRGPIETD